MKKRILSCLMALALCLTLLPTAALAAPTHPDHPICGLNCSHTGETKHPNAFANAKWLKSDGVGKVYKLYIDGEGTYGTELKTDELPAGTYYLSGNSTLWISHPIVIQGDVTICLNGKQIQTVDNATGPVFEVTGSGKLTLTDCTGNTGNGRIMCENCSGVYVNGGTLNLYSGQIANSKGQKGTDSNNKYGGGVYVNSGTFNMYGGDITGNDADYGGGVYVKNGTFNMYGGTIKNNNSNGGSGAGVYVEKNGNFIMKNTASVTGNTIGYGSTAGYGGGVYVNGTFEMHNDASVKDNTANNSNGSSGGGVYVNGGTFKMHNNASVTGNKTKNNSNGTLNGAGVYVNGGEFEMNDTASVTGNTATGNKTGNNGDGGGVYVNSGTFNMNGSASITKNNAAKSYGGGVFVNNGGTFNMNDGAISENTAFNGGGVYMWGGTFNMNGTASITGNTGNGVCVNGGTFTVSDTPTVTENTMNEDASNVFLAGSKTIIIGGTLNEGASIGVTKGAGSAGSVIATGATGVTLPDGIAEKFKIDGSTYVVKHEGNQLVLAVSPAETHRHNWSYQNDGDATIKATCTNTTGDCDVKDGGSVTIKAPINTTYDGDEKRATLEKSTKWQSVYSKDITITYEQQTGDDTYTNMKGGVPKDVGKYKASITVDGKTAFVVYKITDGSAPAKQEQEPLHLASSKDTLAVGETLTLLVDGGSTDGAVTYQLTSDGKGEAKIEGNVLTAVSAGKVTVTAVKEGDTEFAEAKSEPITITITEKSGGGSTPSQPGGSTGGNTGGSTGGSSSGSSSGGGSSSDRDSYDSNPVIKTETKNHADGSTTKTETRKDGSVTATTTGKDGSTSKTETKKDGSSVTENKAADGSIGTVKTDKHGQTEANAKVSAKAVEDAKKSGEAVKAPVEVEASRNSGTAPTVKVELPQNSGKTEVEIPVSNAKPGTVAVLVHADGTEEILKDSIPTENGIRLTVDGSATVKIVDNSKDFIDTRNHWAREEIDFVSARELVNGMSDSIYAPNNSATRAQLWTILARQNDADLNGGNTWYEKAQLWSKDKGISDGTQPDAAINRAQMVAMLWRTMGQPAAGGAANFNDVPANSYYAQAVAWAVEGGITQGVGGDRFDPNATCTRAQIAAFLARSMK